MIKDINTDISSPLLSFADDTRVFKTISSKKDSSQLQKDLNKIYKWAKMNNMKFNEDKFEFIKFGKKGNHITQQTSVRDLGLILSDDATFDQHIEKTVSKCRQRMGYILRTFHTREPETLLTLWKALVIPIIDHCSQLWAPYKQGHIMQLEALQRTLTSTIKRTPAPQDDTVNKLHIWAVHNRVTINHKKTVVMHFHISNDISPLPC
ncbi:uncharacterized protein LOC143026859 [Oratosquilla oratoria]|uniref:uncharacterized protein LOC143026859 n=1 Tax=Oratosquilla oratoria TaxID=337810 RepID=UPI003F770676